MNTTIENTEMAVAAGTDNIVNTTAPATPEVKPKALVGRPRTKLTREVVFVQNADGSIMRRGKGKPAHDSKAMVYSVAWDYKGTVLPENATFLRLAVVKDTRKPKDAPATNPVVPTTAEILPTV